MLAFAQGDAGAFDRLYARHKGTVFRFIARSLPSKADAEEIFQDVWMKAIEARARYEPRAKFTTWIYAIAHNRLVDVWRRKGLSLVPLDGGDDDDQRKAPASRRFRSRPEIVGIDPVGGGVAVTEPAPRTHRPAWFISGFFSTVRLATRH